MKIDRRLTDRAQFVVISPTMWFKAPGARRLRTARPARRAAPPRRRLWRGHPPGDPRPVRSRRLDQCRLHDARPARDQGSARVLDRRADAAARRTPPQVLRAASGRYRRDAAGLSRLHRRWRTGWKNGWRRNDPAAAVVRRAPAPRRLSAEWRDYVLGDLEEEFRARRRVAARGALVVLASGAPLPRLAAAGAFRAPPHPRTRLRSCCTLAADLRYATRVLLRARRRSRSP